MATTPGVAVPGTSVPASSLVGPGGSQGIQGIQGGAPFTTTTADFTMPAAGGSVNVNVADASWVIIGEMVAVQTAGGNASTAASLRCTAKSGNQLTLQYNPPTTLPLASSAGPGLMGQLSGNTTDFVDGTNACQNLANAVTPLVTPSITSVRLRSFNSIGNPGFEVDQRNAGNQLTNAANGAFLQDRWRLIKTGTMVVNTQQTAPSGGILLPGTNFRISNYCLQVTLTTQEASLAAGDYLTLQTYIEGPVGRELASDVSSVSLLVQSSVAPLKFGLALRDSANTYSICKLCTIASAGWNLIPLPNLPVFASGGSFGGASGSLCYQLLISLACGSTFSAPANDVWQSGNFYGAVGQDNFASKPVNSTFQLGFVQHEPGSQSTTLIDKPFTQSLDECLRYYDKSHNYGIMPGAASPGPGYQRMSNSAGANPAFGFAAFKKRMAKVPTVTGYNSTSGAVNTLRDETAAADKAITASSNVGETGFTGFSITSPNAALWVSSVHWTADTGW